MPGISGGVVPVIETARLRLRQAALDDVEAVCGMWADPIVTAYISGAPMTRRQAWMFLSAMEGQWPLLGYGYWIVVERESGAFVGQVGFQRFVREITGLTDDVPEAGWALAPAAHGHGYASEAMTAAAIWADAHVDAPRTVAVVKSDNAASLRVGEKCGYSEIGRLTYLDQPIVLLERPRFAAR